ncbi:glycosyltransferase family 2 protein [Isoptericola sp. b441]|uniref:Glycosyltransferase family 2 protein n=1 Tax=Actinotalea lenta TaxID=3064654 RepID=A0ABT9D7H8_9CELL|nr:MULTISPECIES: glycosyltransferase family 2 protein [unclassified Isoptericola]MDO8106801.1 glycosyltransferase family 2 protein [Isoptericola sp. b441]MDO8121488.1 glycosyltransferase family 2 protein [Isoptericola sp. b490]
MSGTAIVVVSYGSAALVDRNLPPAALDGLDALVVLVDNYRSARDRDEARDVARRRGWELLTPAVNLGFGAGVGLGTARALELGRTELLLVNPDLRATAAVLGELAAACRADPWTMRSPRVLRPDGSVWFSGGEVAVREGTTRTAGADSTAHTGWLSGACLAVSAQLWRACGGFDDDYFLYWEDVDLAWRVRAVGGRLEVRPDLAVEHDVGGTQGGKSLGYLRHNARNRLVFASKHLTRADRWRWVLGSVRYAATLLRRAGITRTQARRLTPALGALAAGTTQGIGAVLASMLRR